MRMERKYLNLTDKLHKENKTNVAWGMALEQMNEELEAEEQESQSLPSISRRQQILKLRVE